MKPKIHLFFFIISTFFFLQCSPTLNYIGNSYDTTTNVSVFFDVTDIQKEYTVMGLLTFNTHPIYNDNDKNEVINLIKNKGKEIGADAVLVTKFSSKVHSEVSENRMSNDHEKLFIEAKFIKFEK